MPMSNAKPVVIAATGDHHLGGTTALCPPIVRLDDGGHFHASEVQAQILEWWRDYWRKVDAAVARVSADLMAYMGGDGWEGQHHHSMQFVSANPEANEYIESEIFGEITRRHPRWIIAIRGTGAHVGGSGHGDEAIARRLCQHIAPEHREESQDPETDNWSSYERRWSVHGVTFNGKHHGRMGRLPWTRAGILNRVAVEIAWEAVLRGQSPPDIAFRSHNHKWGDTVGQDCPTRLIALPCWQAKTEFGHRVSESLADIGGCIISVLPDGSYDVEHVRYRPALPRQQEFPLPQEEFEI